MFKKLNKKGFTLAELLIVVAIIGVLVAISIPIFTTQLEKSREATDEANIRSAYAEVMTAALTDTAADHDDKIKVTRTGAADGAFVWSKEVDLVQTQNGWQGGVETIGGIDVSGMTPTAGKKAIVKYTQSTDAVEIEFTS